jgi:probable rRNA maturation factor
LRELSVAIVGDRTMGGLHERFMGIKGPTDVLSFGLDEDEHGRVISGEVVVCLPEAVRQAKRRRIDVRRELLLYAVHGMLHLSGFDDRTQVDYRKMHRMEDRVLTKLGVGATFATCDRSKQPVSLRKGGNRCC